MWGPQEQWKSRTKMHLIISTQTSGDYETLSFACDVRRTPCKVFPSIKTPLVLWAFKLLCEPPSIMKGSGVTYVVRIFLSGQVLRNEMNWRWFESPRIQKAHGTEITSKLFQSSWFPRVAECSILHEIDTIVNRMIPIETCHGKNRYHALVWKINDIQDGAIATIFRWRPRKGFLAKSSKTKLWTEWREWAEVKKEVQCGRRTEYYNWRSNGESKKRNAVQVECGSIDRIQCSEDERSVLMRKSCAELFEAVNEFPIPQHHQQSNRS
jgi:hypothetical protein